MFYDCPLDYDSLGVHASWRFEELSPEDETSVSHSF